MKCFRWLLFCSLVGIPLLRWQLLGLKALPPLFLYHRWLQTVTGYQFVVAGTNSFGGNKLAADMEKL